MYVSRGYSLEMTFPTSFVLLYYNIIDKRRCMVKRRTLTITTQAHDIRQGVKDLGNKKKFYKIQLIYIMRSL